MKVGTAELSIGDALKTDIFLHANRVLDRAILHFPQLRRGQLALGRCITRVEEDPRPQQTAVRVGSKWRLRSRSHERSLACVCCNGLSGGAPTGAMLTSSYSTD